MLKARMSDGRFIIGIDAENVRRLKAGMPITLDMKPLGGSDHIFIVYGETLGDIAVDLEKEFGKLPLPQPDPIGGEH